MRSAGISELAPEYMKLNKQLGGLIMHTGYKFPRGLTLIRMLLGLSPGEVRLWHDNELGWQSEARAKPGAIPVMKSVSDEIAMTILKGELTHELEDYLMTPDPYLGE